MKWFSLHFPWPVGTPVTAGFSPKHCPLASRTLHMPAPYLTFLAALSRSFLLFPSHLLDFQTLECPRAQSKNLFCFRAHPLVISSGLMTLRMISVLVPPTLLCLAWISSRNSRPTYFLKYILSICYYSCPMFCLLFPSTLYTPTRIPAPTPASFSSCPWVVHISSLASTFPILFLTSPVYYLPTIYASYSLYLFSLSPFSPTDNPPCDLHFCGSVPVLLFCLVLFFF